MQQQREITGAFEVHPNAMWFEDAAFRAVVVEHDSRLFYVTGDLREQRRLHVEVILKARAAARRELDDVRRL